jgi:hypothetical protein
MQAGVHQIKVDINGKAVQMQVGVNQMNAGVREIENGIAEKREAIDQKVKEIKGNIINFDLSIGEFRGEVKQYIREFYG